jgi:hypothetical protein
MKEKFKLKGTHHKARELKPEVSNHEDFKLGQGYGSGERESAYQSQPSKKQLSDDEAPEYQPHQDADVFREKREDRV